MCGMRPLRNFKTNQCCHLIVAADTREAFGGARRSRAESRRPSRIANRAFFLNDEEKTRFVERLWRVATFSCVEVLAYCFMSNHFHILIYVPDPRELSDDELLARIRALYSGTALAEIEKEWKARRRDFARFEQSLPDRVPHLLEKGNDKVAYDILKQLADGPRRPAELRAALGIASANFFTARYLTPLAKSGYIAVTGGEKNSYLPGKQYRILRKGKAVVRA